MGKIKLNLVSGAVVEKPLVSAFSASGNSYVILDNEMNGSMGLPIILVCKYLDNKLTKIEDTNEWQIVKEYLKNIIAGNSVEYINVPESISADDIYYTQLTLPVQSFDALKNAYSVTNNNVAVDNSTVAEQPIDNTIVNPTVPESAPVQNPTPVIEPTPVVEQTPVQNQEPIITPTPVIEPAVNLTPPTLFSYNPINQTVEPVVNVTPPTSQDTIQNVTNELNNINTPVADITPVVDTPIVTPEEPVNMQTMETPEPVNDFVSINDITPITDAPVNNSPEVANNGQSDMFKDQKEAFMQACENMFDALVQKFEKELQNK